MKLNRKLVLVVALIFSVALVTSGTLAYLTDTDDAVNVMTLGNVAIEQHENEDGFEQFTSLYPAYYSGDDLTWTDSEAKGIVKKTVTVENTGSSEAYVRTWFAFEAGELTWEDFEKYILLHLNEGENSPWTWEWEWDETTTYKIEDKDGNEGNYYIARATLKEPLPVGKTTDPSLIELAMSKYADNDVVSQMGEHYIVLVLSQAMQTANMGEKTAAEALAEGFGDNKAAEANGAIGANHPWQNGYVNNYGTWDGTADTIWYNDTSAEFVITTAEQLAGFAELVNGGKTFEGKTVKLGKDIDLFCEDTSPSADGDPVTFRPIGDHNKNGIFKGTFDGQNHTIRNLYQNGWDLGYDWDHYGSYGLFGNVNNATIKNLTLSGGESYIEGGDVSFVAGSATGTCVFEKITIEDSVAATYNNGCGGIIGWSGAGNYTFKDITIAEDAVLAGLWGSFDSSIGGIVGQGEPGATYNFENVDIACRIDAYNDCTASYDYYNYRMCGMIIGRLEETTTIDGSNYPDTSKYNITCNDVTVTYGDWANYHYCRAAGERGKRVEAGYSYDGIAADYDHSVCTLHDKELIPFDQIFGGDQYGVEGLTSYDGVNVVYNNK